MNNLNFTPFYTFKLNLSRILIKRNSNTRTASFSTNTDIKFNHKRILEIISSVKNTHNFKIAFTHKSLRLTNKENKSYDTLEFLGDSILEFFTSKILFIFYPDYSEGDLTSLRSLLVNSKNLAALSKQIELDKYLIIDKNIEKSNKILADIYESFIAVLYLEKEELIQEFLFLTIFNRPETKDSIKDYKLKFKPKQDSIIPLDNIVSLEKEFKENKIIPNTMKEITFKFEDKTELSEEQNNLLKKIINSQESNHNLLNSILKQLTNFKEIITIIKAFEENINIKYFNTTSDFYKANTENLQTKNNSYKQLIRIGNYIEELNNNTSYTKENTYKQLNTITNFIKELNNNTLNTNKIIKSELTKLNYKLSLIILISCTPIFIITPILLYLFYINWQFPII